MRPCDRYETEPPQSGAEVPEQAVVRNPSRFGFDAVRVQEELLESLAVIPNSAPSGHCEVRPTIRGTQSSEIGVSGAPSVVANERVGRAGVSMADNPPVHRRDQPYLDEGGRKVQLLVILMPVGRVDQPQFGPPLGIDDPSLGAPRERAPFDRKRLVHLS